MKKLQTRLYNYFILQKNKTNEEQFRKSRIFVNSLLITIIFSLFYIGNTLVFKMPHIMWQISIQVIFYAILLFLFKNGLSIKVSGIIFTALFLFSTVYDIFFTGGLQSPIMPWLAMTPIIAMLMINLRYAFIFLIACVFAAISISLLQDSGIMFPLEVNITQFNTLVTSSHAGLILIVFVIASVMENAYVSSLQKLQEKNKIIEEEKKRSDELLLNILPAEVMDELKKTGKTTARNYNLVTVLFADFADFTNIIEELPPEDLVSSIGEYFETFDNIIEKYGVEKIKTVGDAYICASGLPAENLNNPMLVIDVALEMMEAVKKIKEKCELANKICFDIRIGIHSGPLVAGVVGVKKFAYDIWGDTVNTAARMQQHGERGKINISGTTHDLIKHRFICTKRGMIEAKHKGLIEMYFVEKRKDKVHAI